MTIEQQDKLQSSGRAIFHIDSTILKDSACLLKLYLPVVRGFRTGNKNISLIFGSSVHKWAEFYFKNNRNSALAHHKAGVYYREHIKEADVPRLKQYLTDPNYFTRVCNTFDHALDHDRRLKDLELVSADPVGPLVECKFSIPLAETEKYVVMLSGTIDGIYRHKDSGIYILNDIKTTSSSNVESYLSGYQLSSQLYTYIYAVHYMAQMAKERGNTESIFNKISDQGVGFCITAINLRGQTQDPKVIRSDVIYPDDNKLSEYKAALGGFLSLKLLPMFDAFFEAGCPDNWRPLKEGLLNGSCQAAWGSGCGYFAACSTTSDDIFWAWMDSFTEKSMYNPLKFR